ncbi:MAG: hypothetical protein AAF517_03580 [Planctomycetota bacterium]
MASTKRRALTITLSLAGLALAAAIGIQVYNSQRYVRYASGLKLDLNESEGFHWDYDGEHLRVKSGRFRGWYLAAPLDALPTHTNRKLLGGLTGVGVYRNDHSLPGLILTERDVPTSHWRLRDSSGDVQLVQAAGPFEGWVVVGFEYADQDADAGGEQRWHIVLAEPTAQATNWKHFESKRGRVFQTSRTLMHLGTDPDAKIETHDLTAEPKVMPVELKRTAGGPPTRWIDRWVTPKPRSADSRLSTTREL